MGKGSRRVSFVGWLSLSWRVLYRKFHCSTDLQFFVMNDRLARKLNERHAIIMYKIRNSYTWLHALCLQQVFAGVYPIDSGDYPGLRTAIDKLTLNDSSVSVYPDSSVALGQGWRLGFLGLLHMDVFKQRLEEVIVVLMHMKAT